MSEEGELKEELKKSVRQQIEDKVGKKLLARLDEGIPSAALLKVALIYARQPEPTPTDPYDLTKPQPTKGDPEVPLPPFQSHEQELDK